MGGGEATGDNGSVGGGELGTVGVGDCSTWGREAVLVIQLLFNMYNYLISKKGTF